MKIIICKSVWYGNGIIGINTGDLYNSIQQPVWYVVDWFLQYQGDNINPPPLQIPGANFSEKPGNNKTPPRSGGNFLNNKTPPRSGGKFLSVFKAKTAKICDKTMDFWIARRRDSLLLKTIKSRREAAGFFRGFFYTFLVAEPLINLWDFTK